MHRFACLLGILSLVLLAGCGGGGGQTPPPQNLSGSWTLYLSSGNSVGTNSPGITLAGYLSESHGSWTGTMHAFDSSCFDPDTEITFTSSAKGGELTFTSNDTEGQVITLTGPVGGVPWWGSAKITGGCADGMRGDLHGMPWLNRLDISASYKTYFEDDQDPGGNVTLSQAPARTQGVFPVSGTIDMTGSICSVSGTIDSGYLASDQLVLHLKTVDNDQTAGTARYIGSVLSDLSGNTFILGTYTYQSGKCVGSKGGLTLANH